MRIISGKLRGRDLGTVPSGVRPTSERVRESLFSVLGSLEGSCVLDLYAGTGALGLEAYSRGASRVVFVERSKRVVRGLRRRVSSLEIDANAGVEIIEGEAIRALHRLRDAGEAGFDLVFLDPPYEAGRNESAREAAIQALLETGLLAGGATVVVEGPKRHPLPPLPGVRVVDERCYGDSRLTWLQAVVANVE